MTRQWIRYIKVEVTGKGGGFTIESRGTDDALKVDFEASRNIGSRQNTGTVAIYNLTKSHRNSLGEEFDQVKVTAGYRDGPKGLIFAGQIRDVKHTRDGEAEIRSTIECGDGDEGINKGVISKTFPKKTKPKQMIEELVKTMPGVTLGEMKGLDDLPETKRPTSMWGYSFRELDELSRQHRFYWSIQNGQFQAVKNDQHLGRNILISKETGMIGHPTVSDKGVEVTCLLNPAIAPGILIDVRSDFLDEFSSREKRSTDGGGGLFRVSDVTFTGTNRGEEFYCEIQANRTQNDKVVK